MLLTWFILGGLILFISPSQWTSNFQFAFFRVFNWPLSIGKNITLSVLASQNVQDTDVVSSRAYRRLANHKANLEARLKLEQRRVEKLSGVREQYPFFGNTALIDALVYPATIDKSQGEVLIDHGGNRHLAGGQMVLAENSIIGTISDVSAGGASVRLFTHPSSSIAVEIGGTKRFMHGMGGNLAKIPMMRYKPKVGERVFAAVKPGALNTPIVLGKVHHCQRNRETAVLWDIFVEPVCDMGLLNDVIVIVMNPGD